MESGSSGVIRGSAAPMESHAREPQPVQTRAELEALIRKRVGRRPFVSVSNREPFVHSYRPDGGIEVRAAVGGLTVALNAAMQAAGGTWVAHGSGDADRAAADEQGRLMVPPEDPQYELQRVWLDSGDSDLYYNGCANQALWPLCHNAFTKPVFRDEHWQAYRRVNRAFADAVAGVVGENDAIVFIQDYHFALLPKMIRSRCPRATLLHFWHIPWPVPDIFAICPWGDEIVDALLGNDVVGFHTPKYVQRFQEAACAAAPCQLGGDGRLTNGKCNALVREFPISIDFEAISASAAAKACDDAVERLRRHFDLEDKFVVLGLDRIDYTKGSIERLLAIERLLERHPDLRGRVKYLHAGAPSRESIPAYRDLHAAMAALERRVNAAYGTGTSAPVVSIKRHLREDEVLALYRLADVCVVSSLDDGMNLVAKEFLAARNDERGRLLLSEFTGAAWELPGAETFNPFATDDFAERLHALYTDRGDRGSERMRELRAHVRTRTVYGWLADILETVPLAGSAR